MGERAVLGAVAMACEVYAMSYLPDNLAISVGMLQIFLVLCASKFILKEKRVQTTEIILVIAGCGACIIMINQGYLQGMDFEKVSVQIRKEYPHFKIGLVFSVIFSITSCLSMLKLAQMSKEVNIALRTYFFGILALFLSLTHFAIVNRNQISLFISKG